MPNYTSPHCPAPSSYRFLHTETEPRLLPEPCPVRSAWLSRPSPATPRLPMPQGHAGPLLFLGPGPRPSPCSSHLKEASFRSPSPDLAPHLLRSLLRCPLLRKPFLTTPPQDSPFLTPPESSPLGLTLYYPLCPVLGPGEAGGGGLDLVSAVSPASRKPPGS